MLKKKNTYTRFLYKRSLTRMLLLLFVRTPSSAEIEPEVKNIEGLNKANYFFRFKSKTNQM